VAVGFAPGTRSVSTSTIDYDAGVYTLKSVIRAGLRNRKRLSFNDLTTTFGLHLASPEAFQGSIPNVRAEKDLHKMLNSPGIELCIGALFCGARQSIGRHPCHRPTSNSPDQRTWTSPFTPPPPTASPTRHHRRNGGGPEHVRLDGKHTGSSPVVRPPVRECSTHQSKSSARGGGRGD
jgi:hypothetical protein